MSDDKVLEYTDQAGVQTSNTDVYNDLLVLATSQNFFQSYRLKSTKFWHIQEGQILGMEQVFYNPDTNDELRPGPHIGYAYSDLATYGELILEDDEYINEIFGCCSRQIDYLHIGTNKGNYIEFGRPDDKNRFRFRIPEQNVVFSITIGLDQYLQTIGIQTIPIEHYQQRENQRPYEPMVLASPTIIQRTDVIQCSKPIRMIVKDDFWNLKLHPHVKRKTYKIVALSCCYGNFIEGFEIYYKINQNYETSQFNFKMESNQRYDKLEIQDDDYLQNISGTRKGSLIDSITFKTGQGRETTWGSNRGKPFNLRVPNGCEIIGIRIGYSEKGIHSLMAYFV